MPIKPDEKFMLRAFALAEKALFSAAPNPRVGCVIVADNQIVGEGWHERAGEAHAEINALAQAGEKAKGAVCYVTLEPCCHHGRTGPCVQALLVAGVAAVVVAMKDPNPRMQGEGIRQLRQQGIEVIENFMSEVAELLNPGFITRMKTGLPWVRLKLAMSLDGRTAMKNGESQWITGEAARSDVQYWRARSDAIVTGVSTVLHDNPRLNVRPSALPEKFNDLPLAAQPLKVILDSNWCTPKDAQLLEQGKTLIIGVVESGEAQASLAVAGGETVVCPGESGRVDLVASLALLGELEINEVLVECGPTLAGAFLAANLVDEFVIYLAPKVLGSDARGLFRLPGLEALQDAPQLSITTVDQLGEDLRLVLVQK